MTGPDQEAVMAKLEAQYLDTESPMQGPYSYSVDRIRFPGDSYEGDEYK